MIDDLERRLVDLGRHIEYPATPVLAASVRQRLPQMARPRFVTRVRVGIALAAAAVVVVFAVPQVRTAIAHWLGIRGVEITPVQTLPPTAHPSVSPSALGGQLSLGELSTLTAVGGAAGFQVLVPSTFGAPDAVYLRSDMSAIVSLVYRPRPGLAESAQTGVGLLVTEFRGTVDTAVFQKFVGPDGTVTPVSVGGGAGFWIAGAPHALGYVLPDGTLAVDTLRLAGPTLVYERGDITIRIEGALTESQALTIASSLH
jgi:hypothetical protein